jgi:AhpD family alkylhydroperoxidase
MAQAKEVLDALREPALALREQIPGVYSGYAATHQAAMAEGAVSTKLKELVALAVAVTRECDGCIAAHARGAARAGATPQEVAEVLGVAILMNGGPGTTWAPRAYEAFLEFSSAT